MYLRIVYARPEKRSRRRIGVVWKSAPRCGSEDLDFIAGWLSAHLPVPPRSAFSGGRALSWFKLEARACIEQVRELASLLERRGERVWQIYSRNPGLITYEDDYQVIAVPESVRLR